MSAWVVQLATVLGGAVYDLLVAKTQADTDKAYEDVAEAMARAKIEKEREAAGG